MSMIGLEVDRPDHLCMEKCWLLVSLRKCASSPIHSDCLHVNWMHQGHIVMLYIDLYTIYRFLAPSLRAGNDMSRVTGSWPSFCFSSVT